MTLTDFMQLPLGEALKNLNLKDCDVHTDDHGQVKAVELKYITTEEETPYKTRKYGV